MASELLDFITTILVLLAVFFMMYMYYKQQGIIETVNEIKEAFEDKVESTKDLTGVYK